MRTANTLCVGKTVPFLQSLQSFLKICDSANLSILLDRSLFSGVQNLLGVSSITKGNIGVWFLAALQTFQFPFHGRNTLIYQKIVAQDKGRAYHKHSNNPHAHANSKISRSRFHLTLNKFSVHRSWLRRFRTGVV